MPQNTFATLLAILLLSSYCEPRCAADSKPVTRQTTTVHFETTDRGLPLVQVRLNDSVTATFMVDTGAFQCTITDSLAKRLGLETHIAYVNRNMTAMLANNIGHFTTIKDTQLGAYHLNNVNYLVVPDKQFLSFPEQQVDGLIGGPVLSVFAMLMDFPRHSITLINPGKLSNGEIRELKMSDSAPLHLKRLRTDISTALGPSHFDQYIYSIQVALENDDRKSKDELYIDTGSPLTLLSKNAFDRLQLVPLDLQPLATMYNGSDQANISRVVA